MFIAHRDFQPADVAIYMSGRPLQSIRLLLSYFVENGFTATCYYCGTIALSPLS